MALVIKQSVGNGGVNAPDDVMVVQRLLNAYLAEIKAAPLPVDGQLSAKGLAAIRDFQARKLLMPQPDGRIEPGGKTFAALVKLYGAVVEAQAKPGLAKVVTPTVSATAAGKAAAAVLKKP